MEKLFNLTKQEKQAVQFILVIILTGALFGYFQKIRFYPKFSKSFDSKITKFDLNQVTFEQLKDCLNLNQKMAQGIIDYRDERGGFSNIEELKEVKGVGKKSIEKLQKKLYLNYE